MMLKQLKKRLFPRGLRRPLFNARRRLTRRVTPRRLTRDLRKLGLAEGDAVCVHSALSSIGHLSGGADALIDVLLDIVGPDGTLMMPAFATGPSTYRYVRSDPPPFDPASTPPRTGRLSTVFVQRPDVRRSSHPTHSVAAAGPLAEALLAGHADSPTPFGPDTPYGRLIDHDGKVLLLGNDANSLLHHVEERVDWPNNYRDEWFDLPIVDGGTVRTVRTRVHGGATRAFLLLPGTERPQARLVMLPSWGLPRPDGWLRILDGPALREGSTAELRDDAAREIRERGEWFRDRDVVRLGPVGHSTAALYRAMPFAERVERDLRAHLATARPLYRRELLDQVRESGECVEAWDLPTSNDR